MMDETSRQAKLLLIRKLSVLQLYGVLRVLETTCHSLAVLCFVAAACVAAASTASMLLHLLLLRFWLTIAGLEGETEHDLCKFLYLII